MKKGTIATAESFIGFATTSFAGSTPKALEDLDRTILKVLYQPQALIIEDKCSAHNGFRDGKCTWWVNEQANKLVVNWAKALASWKRWCRVMKAFQNRWSSDPIDLSCQGRLWTSKFRRQFFLSSTKRTLREIIKHTLGSGARRRHAWTYHKANNNFDIRIYKDKNVQSS